MTGPHSRRARDVVEELFRRQRTGDDTVLDDLVAPDMVNHAAGLQGRDGLRSILRTIEDDLGPTELELLHLIGEGDLVVQHVALHGTHRARVERRPRKQAPKAAPSARRCRDCGAELAETARKLCPACWPVSRARQAQERAAAGTAALAAQRAQGHDPTNTAPAAAKRHESLISERAQRAEWESQNPNASRDPARYLADVAARLPSAPLSQIVKATGVSISAASRIRNGALMPHPRHWDALRRLADSQ
jgi:hypothetical protein